CALRRMARPSPSLFWISKLSASFTSVLHSERSPAISASIPAPASKRRRSVMVLVLLAPQLLEPGVASAIETIEFIADRILHVVILMVLFGLVERAGRHDSGLDRLLEPPPSRPPPARAARRHDRRSRCGIGRRGRRTADPSPKDRCCARTRRAASHSSPWPGRTRSPPLQRGRCRRVRPPRSWDWRCA